MTTIHEALRDLTQFRNQLKRLCDEQKKNYETVIPAKYFSVEEAIEQESRLGHDLEITPFSQYEREIQEINQKIAELRQKIDFKCHSTQVMLDEKSITLAYLRMLVENLRADVDRLKAITALDRRPHYDRRPQLTTEHLEKTVCQISERRLGELIDRRIQEKNRLEALLTKINVSTPIDI